MDLNTLTRLFDGLDSYIIAVDSEFNTKFTNGRVSLISGKHPDEMINKKCYNIKRTRKQKRKSSNINRRFFKRQKHNYTKH